MAIRLGIIGCGRIAERAVREIRKVRELELTAVMNPHRESAENFAERCAIRQVTDTTGALAQLVDAVYIASPHATHEGYARELLQAGIHVLCEKPMSFTKKDGEQLYTMAAENKVVLMEALKTAYCPGFQKIEEVLASGKIGEIVEVEAAFTKLVPEGGREYKAPYGGAFTEFGTYGMLPVLRILGTDHHKVQFFSRPAGEVDGYTKAVLDYGGRFGGIKTGLGVKSEGQLLVSGTKGYLLAPSPWWLTKCFEVRYEDPKQIERYECEFAGDGLRYEFQEFADRIRNGGSALDAERKEGIARADLYERFFNERAERVN